MQHVSAAIVASELLQQTLNIEYVYRYENGCNDMIGNNYTENE